MKVVAVATQPGPGAPRAGQNTRFTGDFTRYDVEFQLQPGGLSLSSDADGTRHKSLQVALMVYGQDFKPLNWEIREIHVSIKPDRWAVQQSEGIIFHLLIDAPAGDVYLRTGVYDSSSSKVGTLEIPLAVVTVARE